MLRERFSCSRMYEASFCDSFQLQTLERFGADVEVRESRGTGCSVSDSRSLGLRITLVSRQYLSSKTLNKSKDLPGPRRRYSL